MPKITFDSDEEFVFEEKEVEKKQDIIEQESESSDDEAPEAISISSSRSKAIEVAKAQKELAIKQAKADKEKRRQRDIQLKEQKKGSKREIKEQTKKVKSESESESDKEMDDEEEEDEEESEDNISNNKLPQSILNELKKSTDSGEIKKRTHLTVEDFERLEAIKEAKEKENLERQRKRQKIQEKGRMVGEYTVKIINQRPKVAKAGKGLQKMKNDQLHRSSIPRRNAVMNASMSRREGGALLFRRDDHSSPKSKSKK